MTSFLARCSWSSLLWLAAAVPAQQIPEDTAPQDAGMPAILQATAARYHAAEWPRGERRAGVRLATLEARGLTGGELYAVPGDGIARRYRDAVRDCLQVEVCVRDTVDAAQQDLLGWLANTSRAQPVPTAASQSMPLGDIGYVGWSRPEQRRLSWLAFVRDNVAVRVGCFDPSADPHPDLLAVAQAVDVAIRREAVVAAEQALPRPVIDAFATAAQCTEDDVVPLSLRVRDTKDVAHVRFECDGPGQGYVEGDLQHGFTLHATGAGTLTVRAFVTGAFGTTAKVTCQTEIAAKK